MIGRCALSGRNHRVRPSPIRWYASTPARHKKDLPPPLPPKATSSSSSSKSSASSLPKAKQDYLEAQKRTGEFLKDPRANIARLQADMDKTKEKLRRVHDKPIWRRVVDRFRAKQHAVINLLAASMAYILAHRLHLKIKENEKLQLQIEEEQTKNFNLRKLMRSLQTEDFCSAVVTQATATNTGTNAKTTNEQSTWFRPRTKERSLPETNTLEISLRQALEAKIGDTSMEDADRKQKHIRDIWQENEQKLESGLEDGLAELAQAIAVSSEGTTDNSKKRVFDM